MSTSDFMPPPDSARTCWTCRWWLQTLPRGTVAITIRVPARAHRTHAELVAAGLYRPAAEMTAPVWRAQLREAYAPA